METSLRVRSLGLLGLLLAVALASAESTQPPTTAPVAVSTFPTSSTSDHIITIAGSAWGKIIDSNASTLSLALKVDILTQISRRFSFNTTPVVTSLEEGSLVAHVSVSQALFHTASDADLQHLWPPDEVNSLIMQGKFVNTLGLYNGVDKAALVSVQRPQLKKNINECNTMCRRIFILVLVILALMALTTIVVLAWILFHCLCGVEEKTFDRSAAFAPYPQERGATAPYPEERR